MRFKCDEYTGRINQLNDQPTEPGIQFPQDFGFHNYNDWKYLYGVFVYDPLPFVSSSLDESVTGRLDALETEISRIARIVDS